MAKIVYLDLNAYVFLANGIKDPKSYPTEVENYRKLYREVESGQIIVVLSWTNIIETLKRNNVESRLWVALTQATLSKGSAFSSFGKILIISTYQFIAKSFQLDAHPLEDNWFISEFYRVLTDTYPDLEQFIPEKLIEDYKSDPCKTYLTYVICAKDSPRDRLITEYRKEFDKHLTQISLRRRYLAGYSQKEIKQLHTEISFAQNFQVLRKMGIKWEKPTDARPGFAQHYIDSIPVLDVEQKLILRLEQQDKPVVNNDLHDMQAMTVAIPYADVVIGEKNFINLAKQAGLHKKYNTLFIPSSKIRTENGLSAIFQQNN